MREQTQLFAQSLLDHARTSLELEIMLNYNPTGDNWEPGERQTLDRLKLAIKYKQKQVSQTCCSFLQSWSYLSSIFHETTFYLFPFFFLLIFCLQFVAHPNVQQLLAAIWYDGLPGFRRKSMIGQFIEVGKLGAMFPVYSTIYMLSPTSPMGLFMKKPFVKFICHSSSYAFFLSKFFSVSDQFINKTGYLLKFSTYSLNSQWFTRLIKHNDWIVIKYLNK